ncbi:MAG: autotransporter, partial [Novosphingobium sp.]
TIKAVISSPGEGAASAVQDKSGTLTAIDNTGTISVTGSTGDDLRAIDLTANTSGVTIKQYLNDIDKKAQATEQAASGYNPLNPVIYASIVGNLHTGSGNDVLDVATGRIVGNSFLGAGDDTVRLSGDSGYVGDINFGAGQATLSLADKAFLLGNVDLAGNLGTLTLGGTSTFLGTLSNAANLDVVVNGGKFGASSAATLKFDSLTVNSGGALNVYIDGATGTSSLVEVNSATFASGSKVTATITSLAKAEGSYTILKAGNLEGTPVFDATSTVLPVLFNGEIDVVGETLVLDVSRKTAAQLGLSAPLGAAYNAIYAQGTAQSALGNSLLQADDVADLTGQFSQLLPDYAGGVFDFVTRSGRIASRHLMDDSSLFEISNVGGWFEPIWFRGSKDETGTAGFKVKGWG